MDTSTRDLVNLAIRNEGIALKLIEGSLKEGLDLWEYFIDEGWLESYSDKTELQNDLGVLIKKLPYIPFVVSEKFLSKIVDKIGVAEVNEIIVKETKEVDHEQFSHKSDLSPVIEYVIDYLQGNESLKNSIINLFNLMGRLKLDLNRSSDTLSSTGKIRFSRNAMQECVAHTGSTYCKPVEQFKLAEVLYNNGAKFDNESCKEVLMDANGSNVFSWIDWSIKSNISDINHFRNEIIKMQLENKKVPVSSIEIVETFERKESIDKIIESQSKELFLKIM